MLKVVGDGRFRLFTDDLDVFCADRIASPVSSCFSVRALLHLLPLSLTDTC